MLSKFHLARCTFDSTLAFTNTLYNEEIVGEALKDVRDHVVIATKFGVAHNPDRSLTLDSSPDTIRKSVDGSLKRLGVDYIDLYYQHRIDPQVEPEIVASVMDELIKAGKIRAWGISEVNELYLRRAHKICPVSAIQNRYSLMARWHENLFPTLEELKISFVAFSPLANGLLTGQYTKPQTFTDDGDYRSIMPQKISEPVKFFCRLKNSLILTLNSIPCLLIFSAVRLQNENFTYAKFLLCTFKRLKFLLKSPRNDLRRFFL